jgi:hypothetical protein
MRHVASRSTGAVVAPGPEKADGVDGEAAIAGETEEERLETLYEQIAWPVGRKYGHPYDAYKLALTCVFANPDITPNQPIDVPAANQTKYSAACPQSRPQR